MLWDIGKYNLLILKRLRKSKQRKDIILEKLFFVQFRAFLYQRVYKTEKGYKQIIHLSTVCSNSQARRERAVGDMGFGWLCVDVVVYVYRRIYFVF